MKHPISTTAVWFQQDDSIYSPEYLLVLPLDPGLSIQDTESHPVPPGTLIFHAPFADRLLTVASGCRVLYAVIASDFLEEFIDIPKKSSVVLLQDGSNTAKEKLIALFDLQYNTHTPDPLKETCTAYELLQALRPSIVSLEATALPDFDPNSRYAQFVSYMDAHFREPIQLLDLAEAFSLSKQHVSTVFHKEMGMPFSEYLQNLRLREAARLLLTTNRNITTVCQNSGFPNLKSFNQSFRQKFGCSPKEFRQTQIPDKNTSLRTPSAKTLENINQLLSTQTLVYQKQDNAISLTDTIRVGPGTHEAYKWNDILNVDNTAECLQAAAQSTLREIQSNLHFRYVRMMNFFTQELVPYIAPLKEHRFTYLFQVIDFFRDIDLIPMLAFGDSFDVMLDSVMVNENPYSFTEQDFLRQLEAMLTAAINRWGRCWVSTWRFEFRMPEQIYRDENPDRFLKLLDHSAALIRRYLPQASIGGPALPFDTAHLPRWYAFFQGLQTHHISLDFISGELWADYTQKISSFNGQFGEPKEIRTISSLDHVDITVAVQRVHSMRNLMEQHGLGGKKLLISASGITKYQATAAQTAGHCAAHLIKLTTALEPLVDGSGCWKALNAEAEYANAKNIISTGCGLVSRYGLKNISYYAYELLAQLLPYKLFQGLHSLVTTDRQHHYSILVNNCKQYSDYFYKNYLTMDGLQYWSNRLYNNTAALRQTFRLESIRPGRYLVKQILIGDRHGSISSVIQEMGEFQQNGADEIAYIAGQSLPYLHTFLVDATETLEFAVTVQANEVMLLLISPESRSDRLECSGIAEEKAPNIGT